MARSRNWLLILFGLLILISAAGCLRDWSFPVEGLEGGSQVIDYQVWQAYSRFAGEDGIPLEQILYGLGARLIDAIVVVDQTGREYQLAWEEAAEALWLEEDGIIRGDDLELDPAAVSVIESDWAARPEAAIYDLAATAAQALGLRAPALSTGSSLAAGGADAAALLFLDGFGYIRYQEALEGGLIPVLAGLDPPLVGLTTYPPITTVSTASLLTGTEPPRHGVEVRGIRQTEAETLLDVVTEAGLTAEAVEGEALAFNLRGAELQLSGDRDGSGGTDDNVLANALAVLEGEMPDLLLVHFHGIDDLGHEVGPGDPAELDKIREVDAAVGQILDRLPAGTLVLIFADHGLRGVNEDGRLGNHGHLIPRDMLIPIWIFTVD